MQAAVVNALGQPPKYQAFPDPTPAEGEVIIQVRAAGLHPIVKALASGTHYAGRGEVPAVPGVDGVGILPDGRRVYFTFARKPWGSMCERTVAPRSPDACPFPTQSTTLRPQRLQIPACRRGSRSRIASELLQGEAVLILGATGVAGQLAIQIARHLGAKRVVAAGRNVEALSALHIDAIVPLNQSEDAVREAFASRSRKRN